MPSQCSLLPRVPRRFFSEAPCPHQCRPTSDTESGRAGWENRDRVTNGYRDATASIAAVSLEYVEDSATTDSVADKVVLGVCAGDPSLESKISARAAKAKGSATTSTTAPSSSSSSNQEPVSTGSTSKGVTGENGDVVHAFTAARSVAQLAMEAQQTKAKTSEPR